MENFSPLEAEKIQNGLLPVRIGSEVLVFDAVESTNDLARKHLDEGAPEGLVLIAESQFSGRGRMGRSWVSLPGIGIYLSVILKPQIPPPHLPQLTLLAGLATVQAVNEFSSRKAQLKWPNDILLNGKKISGILSEYHPGKNGEAGVIIGIGVNANHSPADFPESLQTFATSLKIETGNTIDRLSLTCALLNHLDKEYDAFLRDGNQEVIKKWMDNSDMFGRKITVTMGGSVIHGTALGLDSHGKLLMRTEMGEKLALDSGEVSLGGAFQKR